jgi:hypothetical protein
VLSTASGRNSEGAPLPEIAIAVVENERGKGIGGTLLDGLCNSARDLFPALALNVHLGQAPRGRVRGRVGQPRPLVVLDIRQNEHPSAPLRPERNRRALSTDGLCQRPSSFLRSAWLGRLFHLPPDDHARHQWLAGIGVLLLGPVVIRLYLEFLVVVFRINETLTDMREIAIWASRRAIALDEAEDDDGDASNDDA